MTNIQEKPIYISREEKNGVTQELVKEFFDYKNGLLYWKIIRIANHLPKIGDLAGHIQHLEGGNRRKVKIKGIVYYSSRIIFLWHYGYMPEFVDHADRNTLNDKIENLRAATRSQNSTNRCSLKNSSSKYLGVCWNKGCKKWKAHIKVGKKLFLGYFKTQELAALAYNKAAIKYFGEFANLNIVKP